eukprot:TRINITY_DN12241_c0_g1_i1.p1 TRINITY_DN12241_c0_g1~~TRINITY_DN12241_c0_g1_i1.p1  ORF type:complete len:238 (+),score=96.61 TRINITY_DN12241_c0_g1_i1:45-758(+)
MATFTFHQYPQNNNSKKARAVAAYTGILGQFKDAEFQMGVTNYTKEFQEKYNPTAQAPALETPEGPLFESDAMAVYFLELNENTLNGKNAYEKALIRQWIEFSKNHLVKHMGPWVYPYFGWGTYSKETEDACKAALKSSEEGPIVRGGSKSSLKILNNQLKKNGGYLVGDGVTYADINVFFSIYLFFTTVVTEAYFEDIPDVLAWIKKLAVLPEFVAANYDQPIAVATEVKALPTKE